MEEKDLIRYSVSPPDSRRGDWLQTFPAATEAGAEGRPPPRVSGRPAASEYSSINKEKHNILSSPGGQPSAQLSIILSITPSICLSNTPRYTQLVSEHGSPSEHRCFIALSAGEASVKCNHLSKAVVPLATVTSASSPLFNAQNSRRD
ncbi:hypothetical protein AOLI_G00117490 [Acnodon oligacanthus]